MLFLFIYTFCLILCKFSPCNLHWAEWNVLSVKPLNCILAVHSIVHVYLQGFIAQTRWCRYFLLKEQFTLKLKLNVEDSAIVANVWRKGNEVKRMPFSTFLLGSSRLDPQPPWKILPWSTLPWTHANRVLSLNRVIHQS